MKTSSFSSGTRAATWNGTYLAAAWLAVTSLRAFGAEVTVSATPNLVVPDGNASGTLNVIHVPPGAGTVADVNVMLSLQGVDGGGWNGDLLVFLSHGGVSSYLMNRPGRSLANTLGYGDNGVYELTFDDEAPGDFHLYQSVLGASGDSDLPIQGGFQPDGRETDPDLVLDADPRLRMLGGFDGLSAEGPWRLMLFDLSPGGTVELVRWELTVAIAGSDGVIPEPGHGIFLAGAVVAGLGMWRWRNGRRAEGTAPSRTAGHAE